MNKKNHRSLLVLLLFSFTFISLNLFLIKGYCWEIDKTGTATYIVDGDTLDVSSVGRIRLADIDCPEQGEAGYTEAKLYLTSLVYSKQVYVDVDDITGTDPYGRYVCVIYVYYDATHLLNVNKALLVAGHAEIWDFTNNEFNPYSWNLYVDYQSQPDPPPEPPPDPPSNPPPDDTPDDPTPSDDNQLDPVVISRIIGIGIGAGLAVIAVGVFYKYEVINFTKLKEKLKTYRREKDVHKIVAYNQDPLINSIISALRVRFKDIIIAIYGIGSYFDDSLPSDWKKNDLDIIVIVKSLENISKQEWTEVRYEKKEIDGKQVWTAYITLEAFQDKNVFGKESFSNYEWSLIDIKYTENSKLLYGADIRDKLPETQDLLLDYDDILARGLYHLDKSLCEKESDIAMKEFSKGIFKTVFYFCVFLDKSYRNTTILEIGKKISELKGNNEFLSDMAEFYEEAMIYRIIGQFKTDFIEVQNNFISFIFSLMIEGKLHRKMSYDMLKKYFTDSFSGFPYLIQELQKKLNLNLT